MKVKFELRYILSDRVSGRLGFYETKEDAIKAGKKETDVIWYVKRITEEIVFVGE